MKRALGYRPDEPDERDAQFALSTLVLSDPPAEATQRHLVLSVLNQNPLPSCVSNAYAQGWRMLEARDWDQVTPWPMLTARLAHHYNSRAQHGDENDAESGTYIRTCIKQANKLGRAPESEWPYETSKVNVRPPLNAYRFAADNKAAVYHRIAAYDDARIDEIKRATFDGKPVIFGTSVTLAFLDHNGQGVVERPSPTEPEAGGHAMCVVGYDERGVEIVNSWGNAWGNRGFGWLSWEYMTWHATRDIWALDS